MTNPTDPRIVAAYRFKNGQLLVFDKDGEQLTEYQRGTEDSWTNVKARAPVTATVLDHNDWPEYLRTNQGVNGRNITALINMKLDYAQFASFCGAHHPKITMQKWREFLEAWPVVRYVLPQAINVALEILTSKEQDNG